MPHYKVSTIATLLGVSDDTVRRWLDDGLVTRADSGQNSGPLRIDSASVAALINSQPDVHQLALGQGTQSVRNHLQGLVIALHSDPVMSQVDLQCGPYRVVSLISTESVRELGIEVGSIAMAQIKATNVSLQVPNGGNL